MAETIVFKGIKFRRYPDSDRRSDRVYYTPGIADKQRGVKRLHEEIWMEAHGPIPAGHHIHHADFDPLNNAVGNLVCMTESDHHELHGKAMVVTPRRLEHLESIRPLAAAWHATEEGHAWHVEHATRSFANRPILTAICEQCFSEFESQMPGRFCSNKCKAKWRRVAGLDDETRTCKCGKQFTINRYSKTLNCSRSCAKRGVKIPRKK